MERCPTCGAAVRPGARFCTSCGSRIEEQAPAAPTETQDTLVATPASSPEEHVTPEPDWEAASGGAVRDVTDEDGADEHVSATTGDTGDGAEDDSSWSARWPEPRTSEETTDSPADRFRNALDADSSGETGTTDTSQPSWSWGAPAGTATSSVATDSDEPAIESETIAPENDDPSDAVDDETAASTTENAPATDPRQHATELLDQLRGLIWQIGAPAQPGAGEKNIIRNISRVRGETGDFADLEPIIAAVRDNPRDIDALRDLGDKASRLDDLLASHKRLVSTLEDVISDQ